MEAQEGPVNPLQQLHEGFMAIAPHVVIPKAIQQIMPQAQPEQEQQVDEASTAEADQLRLEQERPWTKQSDYERVITDRPERRRLLTFFNQGQQLLGNRARAGVLPDDRRARRSLSGLNNILVEGDRETYPPKAETTPDIPGWTSGRKSGKDYWEETPRRKRETVFF